MRWRLPSWTTTVPLGALVLLALTWGRTGLPAVLVALVAILLAASVLAAVHHAEVVAHRVGEPFGSLILAVAVTVIEVGLIVMLMSNGGPAATVLARDTVFAAVMITTNGIVGLVLLVAATRYKLAYFNSEGSGAALATVLTLAALTMVLPSFTTSEPGPRFNGSQLTFAAIGSLVLWGLFVSTQTRRHRDFFLPVRSDGSIVDRDVHHAALPSTRETSVALALLLAALVAVVGLAKVDSPAIETAVVALGLPHAFVGVVIALLVLLPETLAAVRNARRKRVQISLNLAYGSAIASIGLTIPTISVVTAITDTPLDLGLGPLHLALLVLTAVVSALTVAPGRATRLQAALHLVIFGAYVFLSAVP